MQGSQRLQQMKTVFALAALCCFLWGSATPAIKIGYQLFSIDSADTSSIIVFAGTRFLLAGILVVLFQSLLRRRFLRPQPKALPAIFALSLTQTAVQYLFFYIGLAHTSGVRGTILSGLGGFLAILAASLLFRYEKLTVAKVLGCTAGFAGIVIMNLSGQNASPLLDVTLLGEGFMVFSQISSALSSSLIKRYSARFDVVMLSGWQFALGGLLLIAAGLAGGGRIPAPSTPLAFVLLLYMALISAVAYTVWGILLQHNPVSRVTIFNFMTPLFGVLLSAVFLGEWQQAFSPRTLIALVLVCLGIYVVNRMPRQKEQTKTA
ncbi:MAG TPA: DMT family transporter [Candidatus Anaerofilum excrementigallinarum]|nr:DMT family transporter [Candidatus Anaerofilum excrementigallinarum]